MAKNSFSNSVVVITGAASGIGRELALQAAAKGALVMATDRNKSELEQTKTLCRERGLDITTAVLDVSDKDAIAKFANEMTPFLNGRKLVLINNAGVGLASGLFQDTDLDDFEWLLNINLWGAIRMTKAFYPYFLQRNAGHIIFFNAMQGTL